MSSQSAPVLTVGTVTGSEIYVSWTGAEDATSFSYILDGVEIMGASAGPTAASFLNLTPLTEYDIIIRAIYTDSENTVELPSATTTVTTLQPVPTKPHGSENSSVRSAQTFTIEWIGGDDATSYTYSLNGSDVTPSNDNGVSLKTALFGALSGGVTYTVIITATNEYGSTSSDPFTATSGNSKGDGSQITNIEEIYVDNVSATGFTLHWQGGQYTGNENSLTYAYLLGDSIANGEYITPESSSLILGPFYATFTGLSLTNSLYYITFTIGSTLIGVGQVSNAVSFTVTPTSPTQPVVTVQSAQGDLSSRTIVWTGGNGATSYTYTLNGTSVTPFYDGGVVNKQITLSNLNRGTNYTIIVSAVNTYGSTDASGVLFKTPDIEPTQPVVTVGTITGTTISISWTGGLRATSYEYTLNGTSAYPTNDNVNGKTATFTGVTPSTNYAIFVTAVNDGGSSLPSQGGVSATTLSPPAPPTNQAVTSLTNTFATAIVSVGSTTEQKIEAASSAIAAALATNVAPETLVAAVLTLAVDSPTIFTALVSNPVFVGASISVPSSVAQTLYANFAVQTNVDTSLPLKVNFPGADGKVTPPISGTNSKLAIDLCGNNTYTPFRNCTGYGIYVINGEQYFATPSNPVGTLVKVGDIITFTVDGGGIIVSQIADLDIVLVPYVAPVAICFLPSAPVLTPSGYCRIDSLKVGDLVSTREGETTAIIEKVEKQVYMPGPDTNPYVIPAGRLGSNSRLLISPRHKVAVNGEMIEARYLGLAQEEQYEKITYYNIQVTCSENIIVAGLEVESLQALTRVNIPMETFNYIIMNKYGGKISDEMKERCHLMPDGTMSVPMLV
jgi:hypothetical protein